MTGEAWRPVVGYEGWYEVSDLGRVRRIRKPAGAATCRILVPTPNTWGYPTVRPSVCGIQRTQCVHLMVSAAFMGPTSLGPTSLGPTSLGPTSMGPTSMGPTSLGPTSLGPTSLGPDGVKANAALTNLEFITHPENMRHAYRLGLNPGHGLKRRWAARAEMAVAS